MDYNEAVPSDGHPTTVTFHWKEHGHHLVTGLLDLFRRGTHVDTDVNFNGHLQVKVHRLVLSVFLPSVDNSIEPALDLKDVADGSDDVRALVEFIYTGRLTVSVDRVQALRRLAEALQFHALAKTIDGLTTPLVSMDTGLPSRDGLIESPSDHPNEFTVADSGGDPLDDFLYTINENYDDEDEEEEDCIRCPLCPSWFDIRKDFERHFMLAHPNRQTQQPRDSIDNDEASPKPSECRAIKGKASEDGGLRMSRHVQSRYGNSKEDMRFSCDQCDANFVKISSLRTHVRYVHAVQQQNSFGDEPSAVRCLLCSFKWHNKSVLRHHFSMTHSRKRLFECNQCDTFVAINRDQVVHHKAEAHTKADRVIHRRRENRKGRFPCDQCGKVFTLTSSLVRHVASIHDSQKPHRCLECFESFARRYRLMTHVKMKHPNTDNS